MYVCVRACRGAGGCGRKAYECVYVCIEPTMEIGEGAERTMSSHVVLVALERKR